MIKNTLPSGDRIYWFSCPKFTIFVATDNAGFIVDGAPIIKKFIGQHHRNLHKWASKFGKIIVKRID